LPVDNAITKEEEAILWRSLERIPEKYREPLVLFYRQHQSIEAVAEELDLTTDAVKQRLTRGRKMLQEQVLAFVEGALQRTNPGKVFTAEVMAVLPSWSASSKAAMLSAAAKSGAAVKGAGLAGWFGVILSPVLFLLGNYASYRMSMDEAETDHERHHTKALFRRSLLGALGVTALLAYPLYLVCRGQIDPGLYASLLINQVIGSFFLMCLVMALLTLPARRRYLIETLNQQYAGNFPMAAYEYCSPWRLLGWPLLHVRIGDRFDVVRGPVKAWIAVGSSHAVGLIFASGGVAVAPISFGGVAIGLFSMGAISLAVLSLGACGFGCWAYGAMAVGWQAYGGSVLAWHAASGGLAVAHDYAFGAVAWALQSNTEVAKQFVAQDRFFWFARSILSTHPLLCTLAWVLPVTLQARIVARARRRREASGQ